VSIENGESRAVGAVLSSPMLKIRTGKRSLWSARFAAKWNVSHGKSAEYVLDDHDDPFDHTFENDALTTDAERYELWREQLYACPHLAVGGVTWGWLAFGIEVGERAIKPKALKKIRIPVSIVQAADDDRVWKQTNKWAAKRITGARYVEVPGAKHEVIMETDGKRQVFLDEFDALADGVAPGVHVPGAPPVAVAPVAPAVVEEVVPAAEPMRAPDFIDPPAPSPFAASFAEADPAIIERTPEQMPVEAAIEDAPEADPAALELSTSAPIAPDTMDVPASPDEDGPPPREVSGH
jgi:hypothetical protein